MPKLGPSELASTAPMELESGSSLLPLPVSRRARAILDPQSCPCVPTCGWISSFCSVTSSVPKFPATKQRPCSVLRKHCTTDVSLHCDCPWDCMGIAKPSLKALEIRGDSPKGDWLNGTSSRCCDPTKGVWLEATCAPFAAFAAKSGATWVLDEKP